VLLKEGGAPRDTPTTCGPAAGPAGASPFMVEWFPPYAPDLNPVEHLWNKGKRTDRANLAAADRHLQLQEDQIHEADVGDVAVVNGTTRRPGTRGPAASIRRGPGHPR
jgi:hypothetical protein